MVDVVEIIKLSYNLTITLTDKIQTQQYYVRNIWN